jgi:SAM-dependent methyltransferase
MVDVLSKFRGQPVEAVCRDYDPAWVGEGRDKARAAGLTNLSFMVGDAFDRESFLKFWDREDVVVASGFYDWITDDSFVKKSMGIIADCLRPGGYFVFTNQSGHVDLEMVEAVFIDFNKQPLRMTTRPAALMNRWAREAGFEIVRSVADEKNYYTVTLAKKI